MRDEINSKINYINADKLKNENLYNVTITEFNQNFDLIRIITAEEINIKNKKWKLKCIHKYRQQNF